MVPFAGTVRVVTIWPHTGCFVTSAITPSASATVYRSTRQLVAVVMSMSVAQVLVTMPTVVGFWLAMQLFAPAVHEEPLLVRRTSAEYSSPQVGPVSVS